MEGAAPATVGLREQRKREVRGRISDAAVALFAERGCKPVTVEEICERAEVARNTEESGRKLSGLNACFLRVFREGQERGDVGRAFSAGFLADMIVGALNGITLNWVHDRHYPIARLQDLSRMITHYVIARRGPLGRPSPP